MLRALVATLPLAGLFAQAPESRPTKAERSAFTETSTHDEVLRFLASVAGPRVVVRNFGKSGEGKPLPVAIVSNPPCDPEGVVFDSRLRVLVVANIHGGEVEGKEAAQILLRECAEGQHDAWLKHLVLLVVPNFNPDGNDRIEKRNRVEQNGPDGGVGRRENAAGLDLNRDFVKLETPEGQALVALMNRFDPHALLDLHTTNGSFHGYHVTYATSQSPNVPSTLAKLASEKWLPGLVERLARSRGIRSFPYGNVERQSGQQVWSSFDHRPRFLTNYYGLRGRLALLCEAYSYLPFAQRVAVTRAFVDEALRGLVELAPEVREAVANARSTSFGFATTLEAGTESEVLLGEVERVNLEGLGTRLVAKDVVKPTPMRVRVHFTSQQSFALPPAYAVAGPSAVTSTTLLRHGASLRVLEQSTEIEGEVFLPSEIRKAGRSFQKHLTLEHEGRWKRRTVSLPVGSLVAAPVDALTAQLLDAASEDSLGTWNHFETSSRVVPEGDDGAELAYPVVRCAPKPMTAGVPAWSSALVPSGSSFHVMRPVVAVVTVGGEAAECVVFEGERMSEERFAEIWRREAGTTKRRVVDLASKSSSTGGVEVRVLPGARDASVVRVRNACEQAGSPVVRVRDGR